TGERTRFHPTILPSRDANLSHSRGDPVNPCCAVNRWTGVGTNWPATPTRLRVRVARRNALGIRRWTGRRSSPTIYAAAHYRPTGRSCRCARGRDPGCDHPRRHPGATPRPTDHLTRTDLTNGRG